MIKKIKEFFVKRKRLKHIEIAELFSKEVVDKAYQMYDKATHSIAIIEASGNYKEWSKFGIPNQKKEDVLQTCRDEIRNHIILSVCSDFVFKDMKKGVNTRKFSELGRFLCNKIIEEVKKDYSAIINIPEEKKKGAEKEKSEKKQDEEK